MKKIFIFFMFFFSITFNTHAWETITKSVDYYSGLDSSSSAISNLINWNMVYWRYNSWVRKVGCWSAGNIWTSGLQAYIIWTEYLYYSSWRWEYLAKPESLSVSDCNYDSNNTNSLDSVDSIRRDFYAYAYDHSTWYLYRSREWSISRKRVINEKIDTQFTWLHMPYFDRTPNAFAVYSWDIYRIWNDWIYKNDSLIFNDSSVSWLWWSDVTITNEGDSLFYYPNSSSKSMYKFNLSNLSDWTKYNLTWIDSDFWSPTDLKSWDDGNIYIAYVNWYSKAWIYKFNTNEAPTLTSLTSTSDYINISNSWSINFSINWITDNDSWQNINLEYSLDGGSTFNSIKTISTPISWWNENFNLDFTWELDWINTITVRANDWIANSNTVSISLEKDTVKPELSNISELGLTNDNTPNLSFTVSEDNVSINYWWTCASSDLNFNSWNNSTDLNLLSDWVYSDCTLLATDKVWNNSLLYNINSFTVDTIAPSNPTNISYNSGSLLSQSRDVNIDITHSDESDVDAWCILENWIDISNCVWWNKSTSFTFDSDWYKNLDFYLRDLAWNVNHFEDTNSILVDTVDPIVALTKDADSSYTNTWKLVASTVIETNLKEVRYEVIDNSLTCNSDITFSNIYNVWNDIILDNELYNWNKICFRAEDEVWRYWYTESSLIENIDMTNPEEPNISSNQSGWNTIKFKWTCVYEEWLQFVVIDNWVEIARENLTDPCVIDFEYILPDSEFEHNIEYYLEDRATNKSLRKQLNAYVDSSGVLITPQWWKTVEPIVNFFWFGQPNSNVKIYDTDKSIYIAEGSTDANWTFNIQTETSQALGDLTIDLELAWNLKNEPRTINIASSSIIVPTIDEDSVYSKYSGDKDIYSFESQIISFSAMWEPLSKFKVYSYAEVDWERVITEIAEWKFDSNWEAFVSSNVELPGWENQLFIQDTIHNVSSTIVYMVIADPFGTVYDSETKQAIPNAKISFCREWETTLATLPLLHWEEQPNPVTTDSDWNYFSYHEVGNIYYICWVEANWYTFPSTVISEWTNNLDWTPNIGSHGQIFEIIPTPLHIDIPLDRKVEIQKTSWWWGWGGWWINTPSILKNYKTTRKYSKVWNRQLMVLAQEWTETEEKTLRNDFGWGVYAEDLYRVMYESWICSQNYKCWIGFTKPVLIQITDLNLSIPFELLIRYSEEDDFSVFNDYDLNWNTISFTSNRWFELKINKDIKKIDNEKNNTDTEKQVNRYITKTYKVKNVKDYLIYINRADTKYGSLFDRVGNDIIINKFPKIFIKIEALNQVKLPEEYKYVYNYLASIYNERFDRIYGNN